MTNTLNDNIRPLPEMLGRKDRKDELGAWQVGECRPARGEPFTNIVDRVMRVPQKNEVLDRVVRAHEMMHAKVSPAEDFPKWVERGIATETALRVVEELRVNYLTKKAGFDIGELTDGSELTSGMQIAERGDWASAVYTAVGYALCGSSKDFLTGVRRVNRAWGATLKDIVKRAEKEIKIADKSGTLASTEIDPRTGLNPLGFSHTERLAEWVDRLANPPKNEDEQGEDNEEGNEEGNEENDDPQDKKDGNPKGNGKAGKQKDKPAPVDPDKVNPAKPRGNGGVESWAKLIPTKLPLTRRAKGGLGRKRIACNVGRNPRRIGNALVDPDRRVFDRTKRSNGGVVLIDGSGSMSLSHKDILDITENAPGATVAVYATDPENKLPNLFVLAEKGRMVEKLPERHGGNGVDGEAIRWAIKQKQHAHAPVVWITDGQVHGVRNGYSDFLGMDCIKETIKGKVLLAPNVREGIEVLKALKASKKPKRWFPHVWAETYERLQGRRLGA